MEHAKRLEIADGVPHALPDDEAVGRRQRSAGQAIVNEEREINPAPRDQRVRGGEAGVAFDQLELAVALVQFELDVRQTSQADVTEEPRPQFHGFRNVIRSM